MVIFYFVIALGLLIFVHELGHFIVAKRAGICVEAFSLGFGPRLVGLKRGGTDYRISLLPLGGYVKMRGEDPEEDNANAPDSFSSKGVWTRIKVVAFGSLMNLVLCFVLMPFVFILGRPEPVYLTEPPVLIGVLQDSPAGLAGMAAGDRVVAINGRQVRTWEDVSDRVLISPGGRLTFDMERGGKNYTALLTVGEMPELKGGYVGIEPIFFLGDEAVIDGVQAGGPADESGLKTGDRVVSFAGTPVAGWLDLITKVNANGGELTEVVVERDGQKLSHEIRPVYNDKFGRFVVGISKDRQHGVPMVVKRLGFFSAVVEGAKENIKLAGLTFSVLGKLITFKLSFKILGGPIVIAKTSAAAAASGLSHFLYFLAFLSLQLSILNFLPIPVLDGGHLVFLGVEAVRRRPVSTRIRAVANQVGFAILVSLMLVVTFNDADSIWGIRAMLKKIF